MIQILTSASRLLGKLFKISDFIPTKYLVILRFLFDSIWFVPWSKQLSLKDKEILVGLIGPSQGQGSPDHRIASAEEIQALYYDASLVWAETKQDFVRGNRKVQTSIF